MLLRFGYVANATRLADCSPSKTVTATNLCKIDEVQRVPRLRRIARENLANTLRILRYNAAHNVHVYRFTSKLIPLATHPLTAEWDYAEDLRNELVAIGNLAKQLCMRVSAHPDHFTVLNSPNIQILVGAVNDLLYHARIFGAMGLDSSAKLVIHVGGAYKSEKAEAAKDSAISRFLQNVRELPTDIRDRLVLENDDKSYTASDVLKIGKQLGLPVCLDLHHYRFNREPSEELAPLLKAAFATWKDLPPKIHISSPKSERELRSHADYVDPADMVPFLAAVREVAPAADQVDVMVEAKMKDDAMFRLVAALADAAGVFVVDEANLVLS